MAKKAIEINQKIQTRVNDPEKTKSDIIKVATAEFSKHGLNGSRVDEIAELTNTSKRMIYYYFGSKDGLYRAVLEKCYESIRTSEENMHLEDLPPIDALTKLVQSTFDYHQNNNDFVRLVMVENIHQAQHLRDIKTVKKRAVFALETLTKLLNKGIETGDFREDLDPLNVHLTISALCFYNVSNKATVKHLFGHDMANKENAAKRRANVTDIVLRSCLKDI